MDVLAGFQIGGRASLDQVAQLIGCPGQLGMSGSQVWDEYLAGNLQAIQNYCETDAVNTYLVFLRFQLMRGLLDQNGYEGEIDRVRCKLADLGEPHWQEFLDAWDQYGR
jgi:predicted PolB exonuclease-like 3'-5' exonuclease